MPDTREDVLAAVAATFPGRDAAPLAALDRYGAAPHERERSRVQLAIVALSGGNEQRLRELVDAAKVDYRDILAWASSAPLSLEEGAALQRRVRELLERWGGNKP